MNINNKEWLIEDGILKEYRGQSKYVVIPNGVEVIAKYALNNKGIISIIFPDTLKNINDFSLAKNEITKIILPKSISYISVRSFSSTPLRIIYTSVDTAHPTNYPIRSCLSSLKKAYPGLILRFWDLDNNEAKYHVILEELMNTYRLLNDELLEIDNLMQESVIKLFSDNGLNEEMKADLEERFKKVIIDNYLRLMTGDDREQYIDTIRNNIINEFILEKSRVKDTLKGHKRILTRAN